MWKCTVEKVRSSASAQALNNLSVFFDFILRREETRAENKQKNATTSELPLNLSFEVPSFSLFRYSCGAFSLPQSCGALHEHTEDAQFACPNALTSFFVQCASVHLVFTSLIKLSVMVA